MSRTTPQGPAAREQHALRRAALGVGFQLAAATAVVVLVVLAVGVTYVALHSGVGPGTGGDAADPRVSLEAKDLLQLMLLGGAAGIVLSGVVGVVSARRAVRPLGAALERQRRFAQDVSHELRTPLTVLDTRLQLLQRRLGDEAEAAAVLRQLRADSTHLAEVIGDLLGAVGASAPEDPGARTDLFALAGTVVGELEGFAGSRGIDLVLAAQGAGPLPVAMAQAPARRMITTLVENAAKYTPAGGSISVGIGAEAGSAVLRVTDTGTGIVGIDPSLVFERNARGGPGAPGSPLSTGIGLSLAREVATRAGGSIVVESTGPQGTTLCVRLPLAAGT